MEAPPRAAKTYLAALHDHLSTLFIHLSSTPAVDEVPRLLVAQVKLQRAHLRVAVDERPGVAAACRRL